MAKTDLKRAKGPKVVKTNASRICYKLQLRFFIFTGDVFFITQQKKKKRK